jgi:NitT/TauT family transport system substrate-binding protein
MGFRFASTAFVVGLSAALSIAAPAASAQTAPLNPRVALKVGAIGAVSDAGIFIAQEKGYFKDEGLDVEIVGFKAAPQILPAIATGEVQVSGSAVTPALFNAFARGIVMKLVADKGQVAQGFGFAAIVIRSDLAGTIRDFKDLKGRKFAVMGKGVSSTTQLGKALELGGIEPNEVELIELGLPEMVAALGNKAIDGATLLEPFITFATARNVGVRWKGMEDFLPFTGQNGVIIYSQKFAQEQPEAAKRWMAAYLKGTRAYLDSVINGTDRDGINAILAKYTAVKDLALLAKMAPTGFDPNGRMEIKSLEADQDWFLKLGCSRDAPTSARSSTINTWITRWRGWASAERTRASRGCWGQPQPSPTSAAAYRVAIALGGPHFTKLYVVHTDEQTPSPNLPLPGIPARGAHDG